MELIRNEGIKMGIKIENKELKGKDEGRFGLDAQRGKERHSSSPPKASQFPYIRLEYPILESVFLFILICYIWNLTSSGRLFMKIL